MGCGSSKPSNSAVVQEKIASGEYDAKDYEDLIYLANKREIKVTIQASTKAGLAAGLSVMAGTLVAGPVGAAVGGAIGTAMAVGMSKNVVGLNKLLEDTPPDKRGEIVKCFQESFKEEFLETINDNPELKLLLRGGSPIGVVRYMVEKDIIQSEQAKRLDGILTKIT